MQIRKKVSNANGLPVHPPLVLYTMHHTVLHQLECAIKFINTTGLMLKWRAMSLVYKHALSELPSTLSINQKFESFRSDDGKWKKQLRENNQFLSKMLRKKIRPYQASFNWYFAIWLCQCTDNGPSLMVLLFYSDPCLVRYCGKGRECVVTPGGTATCACQRRCPPRGRVVCGTDGVLYSNHCQLHRTACIEDRNIAVDHAFACSKPRKKPPRKFTDGLLTQT